MMNEIKEVLLRVILIQTLRSCDERRGYITEETGDPDFPTTTRVLSFELCLMTT